MIPILLLLTGIVQAFDVIHYGAVAGRDDLESQMANVRAFQIAMSLANTSDSDRTVLFPKRTFYMMPVMFQYLQNVTIIISGKLVASTLVDPWTVDTRYNRRLDLIRIQNSYNVTIRGGGKIDGRGHHWWILQLLRKLKHGRPHLLDFSYSEKLIVHDLDLKNSPNFFLKFGDCTDIEVYNLNIKVNTTAQLHIVKRFWLQGAIPMFPFNTDGIDLFASQAHIYNVTCQNWDDVVVPKPLLLSKNQCAEDILVQNITVRLGVGMSIGSVSPDVRINCIRNVTFRNIVMERPFKGIYIKTNPGNQGSAIIDNIKYQNITMYSPIWWPIYIGPQQMKNPTGEGPGCLLYPYDPKGTCHTQPLVNITNIEISNVSIFNSLLYPVIIRCNVSNPCKNVSFVNVKTDKWHLGQKQTGVVCENVQGMQQNTTPSIYCINQKQRYQSQHIEKTSNIITDLSRIWQTLENSIKQVPYQDQPDGNQSIESIIHRYADII